MLRFILVAVLTLMLVTGRVHAQTPYSWANAANGNWNIGGNWNPAAIPGALDSALINATGANYTVTLNDTQSINNLTINSANATFSHSSGTLLNLGGTLTLTSGSYQISSNATINGGQIVSTVGMQLSGSSATLNNVILGNATNPDVIPLGSFASGKTWQFSGSTDFQTGFVPTLSWSSMIIFGTPRVLNTSYNLNEGFLNANAAGYITLKQGNIITASGLGNYIYGYNSGWDIKGTVKTNASGSTSLNIWQGISIPLRIGATGSVIAGTSSGNANISIGATAGHSLSVDGTIRANSGGTITIVGSANSSTFSSSSQVVADGGTIFFDRVKADYYGTMRANPGGTITISGFTGLPHSFNSSSQFIADGGTIIIDQPNTNIYGTLNMMNGGTISLASGTTNITNNGTINVSTPPGSPPSKMEVGTTPDSTITNPGNIIIGVGSSIIVGGGGGTVISGGNINIDGTLNGGLSLPSGGTASGSGTITGPVVINPLGGILPGNSPGKMTIQNGLMLGGQYGWELGSNTEAGPGINFDQIVVTAGNVVINSTATLKLTLPGGSTTDPFWANNHSWEIIDNTGAGTTSGLFDVSQIIGGTQPNGYFTTSLVGNDVFLNWTFAAVPEPSTWAMIALTGLCGYGAYHRRRLRHRKQLEASL